METIPTKDLAERMENLLSEIRRAEEEQVSRKRFMLALANQMANGEDYQMPQAFVLDVPVPMEPSGVATPLAEPKARKGQKAHTVSVKTNGSTSRILDDETVALIKRLYLAGKPTNYIAKRAKVGIGTMYSCLVDDDGNPIRRIDRTYTTPVRVRSQYKPPAGRQPRQVVRRPRVDLDVVQASKLYESGLTLKQVAQKMGSSQTTVNYRLHQAGVQNAPQRGRQVRPYAEQGRLRDRFSDNAGLPVRGWPVHQGSGRQDRPDPCQGP